MFITWILHWQNPGLVHLGTHVLLPFQRKKFVSLSGDRLDPRFSARKSRALTITSLWYVLIIVKTNIYIKHYFVKTRQFCIIALFIITWNPGGSLHLNSEGTPERIPNGFQTLYNVSAVFLPEFVEELRIPSDMKWNYCTPQIKRDVFNSYTRIVKAFNKALFLNLPRMPIWVIFIPISY